VSIFSFFFEGQLVCCSVNARSVSSSLCSSSSFAEISITNQTNPPTHRITTRLLSSQHHAPAYHAIARPQLAETEATYRAIALSTLTDTPILIVHMSSPVAIAHARKAQSKLLLPVHAETCPHYLYLLSERLAASRITVTSARVDTSLVEGQHEIGQHQNDTDAGADADADLREKHTHHDLSDPWAGASHVCAPPLRHSEADLQAVWDGVHNGTITVISSDHAPSRYNSALGKRKPVVEAQKTAAAAAASAAAITAPSSSTHLTGADEGNDNAATTGAPPKPVLPTASFAQIPNGLPGIETRLPLLFSAATSTPSMSTDNPQPSTPSNRTLTLPKFVELTSTNPARLYGLGGRKGSIAPGYDADLVIWYPASHRDGETTIENRMLHHSIDYTPFEGMKVKNWPRYVLLRGQAKWDRDVELREGLGKGLLGKPGDGLFLKRGPGEVLVGRVGQNPQGMKEGERTAWMS
jgi:dihydropyrimidinase